MIGNIAAFLSGVGVGGLVIFFYLDSRYWPIDKKKIDKKYWDMYEQGIGTFVLSFLFNPPKVTKPASKLTIVKGDK